MSSYRTYTLKTSERNCKYLVESRDLAERYCFLRSYDTKYTITINKKEQDFEYIPNIDDVKYTLYDGLTVIVDEYVNIFDIIQVPKDITPLDVFLLYKQDKIVGEEVYWKDRRQEAWHSEERHPRFIIIIIIKYKVS